MALQFGLLVPQGWTMDLARIKDPVEAYETMTRVAQTAEDPATVKQKLAVLKQHCETVGREYESIRRTSSTLCLMADSDEQALAQLPAEILRFAQDDNRSALIGSPETIRKLLAAYEEAGVQELLLRFVDGTNLEALRRFAQEFFAFMSGSQPTILHPPHQYGALKQSRL